MLKPLLVKPMQDMLHSVTSLLGNIKLAISLTYPLMYDQL